MISLQSHNQVLYHLTQLTSAFTPRSSYSARLKARPKSSTPSPEILCEESLLEAAKNCTELPLENLNIRAVSEASRLLKTDVQKVLKRVNRIPRTLKDPHDDWRISYISGASFSDNKQGLSYTYDLLHRNIFILAVPTSRDILVRGFKTHRNVKAEIERNPSLFGRLRTWIGLSKTSEGKPKAGIDGTDLENLKNILNDTDLAPDEKQRVKIAFAEGYVAGNERKSPDRKFKWLKLIQQVVMTAVGLFILGSIMASTNGSVFRIQLGSHSAVNPEEISVTFADVKGVTEAKQELEDIVEFLKNPEKFSTLGGRLPKGVLLVGPPGTGKTLLARAVAGEARVPFFHAAGSEFDEILVGQGARRVRDLFKAAKERAPCVVFIDEIDSVGGKRTSSVIHPYANQTINQLLSEMDGFHPNEGVIVLGATNRKNDLDKALLRPGRFDVEVYVHKPDIKGRREILELYLSKVLAKSIDIEILARSTTGFTGADIETMVNQAALRAAVEGADFVTMDHLHKAMEKVVLGPELKGMMPDNEENVITAYHEAGHAIVSYYTKDSMPLSKVTIIPRAGSLGHTSYVPAKDVYHNTKSQLLASMDSSFGGRVAEELIFGPEKITTGSAADLQRASEIAASMVKNYGMSEKAGFRTQYEEKPEYSPSTNEVIDGEVKRLLQESYDRAKNILKTHAKEHKLLAEALLKYETLDVEDIKAVINGKTPKAEPANPEKRPQSIIDVPGNVM
ncbi:ATP-dependent zinc metalloprotease YME1L1 isoform X3 [Fopius arisanus]|uniref:ATP-dependent zinc metalloprotease YME1L1 isoform X3 n=1 Tax=Fopius arisanus TaxID=64838 RepID=A0A0C9R6S7_9HYME|nr:PREDICTED: ATP-dependent zinc metalloprotease YME1L1 isoform X3 [Fopius arisanus]